VNKADAVLIENFSLEEKLALMDRLWEDLSRVPESVPSPEWHGDILAKRLADLAEGKTGFCAWEDSKARLLGRFE